MVGAADHPSPSSNLDTRKDCGLPFPRIEYSEHYSGQAGSRICLARSLRERTGRGLQSAGRLGSEGTLKFTSADLQCSCSCGINPALLAHPWYERETHTPQ